jgi:hypothetical protein
MDLLATVRKEGARGGRGDFKWSDVQSSSHRENYLGHSLMAPVGRWQKGRDLNWYAKADSGERDGEDPAARAERDRKEEIKRIKEAEQDALARALGFEVAPRNPNMEVLGDRTEVDKILKEAAEDDADAEGGQGVGFGAFGPGIGPKQDDSKERIEGNATMRHPEAVDRSTKIKPRGSSRDRRRRSRSRSKDRMRDSDRRRRRHEHRARDHRRLSTSRERHQRQYSRSRSRSKSRERRLDEDRVSRRGNYPRDRSRSPLRRQEYRRSYDQYDRHERRR